MDVIWRDIKGFEGRRLRIGTGYRMTKDCILHPMENKYGYLYVTLDGRNTNVHRLVAMAFLPIIDLANIRISHKNKEMTQIELANKYNVSRSHIQYILNFKGRFSWQKPVQ